MPGISFLFWNIGRRPLRDRVARLVATHSPDVVILAECVIPSGAISRAVNGVASGTFRVVPGSGSELRLFTRLPLSGWHFWLSDPLEAWIGFRVSAPQLPDLLLFALHLPSKLQTNEPDRLLSTSHLAADIRLFEEQESHQRTIVVGDLNVNPFEAPAAWAGGLHGVMARDVASRETREIRTREYTMFYNPMWGLLGDRTPGPAGTYYRSSSESVNYFWNTYDQALVRPALMNHLSDLRVLDTDGTDSLLTPNGLPDAANGSDHLPLLFRLDW
jgi:hypothetical protein